MPQSLNEYEKELHAQPSGNAASFIKRLKSEVLGSKAVKHPYLELMSKGGFPNYQLALQDFAWQYGAYSNEFSSCVSAVIDSLSDKQHQSILLENLEEENGGHHHSDLPAEIIRSIERKPHRQLYREFQSAIDIDETYRTNMPIIPTAKLWGQQFLQLCKGNQYLGVGALGLGTELIVSQIYKQILEGLNSYTNLTREQRVFFELHSQCDEDHAAQLMLVTEDLCVTDAACEQVEYGVRMAITMRVLFWDRMLQRAQVMKPIRIHA